MSLRDEIKPYIDQLGYVCPNIPDQSRGSDNGTLFSSELYILLRGRGEGLHDDANEWETLMRRCMPTPGLTVRSPGDTAVDAPDNLYGILAAAQVLDRPKVALDILNYGKQHWGFYNPTGSFRWNAFQWRQPQLLFSMITASGQYRWWNPIHCWLNVWSAAVIATSCIGTPVQDTDPRRLAWLLQRAVCPSSWLCRQASKVWKQRLKKDYPDEMRGVASIYYKPPGQHPFAKYWP